MATPTEPIYILVITDLNIFLEFGFRTGNFFQAVAYYNVTAALR